MNEHVTAFENEVKANLKGAALTATLDLVAYLAANEIYPDPNDHNWFKYKGEMIFFFMGKTSIYTSNFDLDYAPGMEKDEEFENYVLSRVNKCAKHKGCIDLPGYNRVLFGQKFEELCRSTLCLKFPPAKNLPFIKKIAAMRKHDIDNMPELKRDLRADINSTLDYHLKSQAHQFVDYLFENYELKRGEDKTWYASKDGKELKIEVKAGVWIPHTETEGEWIPNKLVLTTPSGEEIENPIVDKVREQI